MNQTSSTKTAMLAKDIHFATVPFTRGDAFDHCAGGGVIVNVRTSDLRSLSDGLQIKVTYTITEVWPDYPQMSRTDTIRVFPPDGFRIVSAGEGCAHCNFSRSYPGKDHAWHDVSDEITGTFLTALTFRFDGSGREDRSNAALRARLEIPVALEPRRLHIDAAASK